MTTIRPLVAGNWKMNGTTANLKEARLLAAMLRDVKLKCDVTICPPATLIRRAKGVMKGSKIKLGGQDCHAAVSGAHTGDISADMLKDAGATSVIVGHSERRTNHKETDAMVSAKAQAAHKAGLRAIICVGETLDERKGNKALEVLTTQLKGSVPAGSTAANTVIAYEPVWAIGTGLTATAKEVEEAHAHIRAELSKVMGEEGAGARILYGGSVKGSNAAELMGVPNVNGALVGGASLKAVDFIGILKAYL
ncbi:triose-phosphate isomerase [Aestuariivirga litoralis]|uniref:triose-phosphate isomerase n=1 Tax=Aestuariivirga litoralis TaxID=2650924 RepID=UPI0018C5995B|nr:triose-phosphate isomerase [Aestuariivirga litoralis]MBG1231657.1 triose-phosphate isomerase [Aestuariivirga litoralis]